MPLFENEEVEALRARVRELETYVKQVERAADANNAEVERLTRERDSWRSQRDEVHAEMERQSQMKHEERQQKLERMSEVELLREALRDARQFAEDVREWAKDEHAFEWDDGDESVRDRAAWVALQASAALAGSPVETHVCPHGMTEDACRRAYGTPCPGAPVGTGRVREVPVLPVDAEAEARLEKLLAKHVPPNAALIAAFDTVERQRRDEQRALAERVREACVEAISVPRRSIAWSPKIEGLVNDLRALNLEDLLKKP